MRPVGFDKLDFVGFYQELMITKTLPKHVLPNEASDTILVLCDIIEKTAFSFGKHTLEHSQNPRISPKTRIIE